MSKVEDAQQKLDKLREQIAYLENEQKKAANTPVKMTERDVEAIAGIRGDYKSSRSRNRNRAMDPSLLGPNGEKPLCGAPLKNQKDVNRGGEVRTCKRIAGQGTTHFGRGPCDLHGGEVATVVHADFVRYRGFSTDIDDVLMHHLQDPDPLNLISDIALCRATIEKWTEDYHWFSEAMHAWHESFKQGVDEGKPTKIPAITEVSKLLDTLARLQEKELKRRHSTTITMQDLIKVMSLIADTINRHVTDPGTREKVHNEIRQIALSTRAR